MKHVIITVIEAQQPEVVIAVIPASVDLLVTDHEFMSRPLLLSRIESVLESLRSLVTGKTAIERDEEDLMRQLGKAS